MKEEGSEGFITFFVVVEYYWQKLQQIVSSKL